MWRIPLLCVQGKTPDGQRNCPKHVKFYSKNKFEKLVHLVGFIIRKNPLTTFTSSMFHIYLLLSPDYAIGPNSLYLCQDGTSWSCSQAVSKFLRRTPLLCVQWKIPADVQRNCPKHLEFYSKNKFEKLAHLFGFVIWTRLTLFLNNVIYRIKVSQRRNITKNINLKAQVNRVV